MAFSTSHMSISATDSSGQGTPAAEKFLAKVEIAEMILTLLPFEDLLNTMRTCKTLCTTAKTSTAVMRDRPLLTSDTQLGEPTFAPPFNRFLSFLIAETPDKCEHTIEMAAATTYHNKTNVEVVVFRKPGYTDTVIKPDVNKAELWRRIPISHAGQSLGVTLMYGSGSGKVQKRTFAAKMTIGDLYDSLSQ